MSLHRQGLLWARAVLSGGGLSWGRQEAASVVVQEHLSFLFLKIFSQKAMFYSACHYAKSFSLEDNSCSQKKDLHGVPRV